ncbi:MAG: hypothetical protein E7Z75_02995 [Methanobrevibacter olleyae]|uniref:Adhesin-like protein n=1 Tax=Methanobrevibacter olleyae TaxID=294671 RepID=A0A8T3VN70_METOL|nr:hypothetical protein [Methanobrevibacter olleyae]
MLKKTIAIILIVAAILTVSYLYPSTNLETEIFCYGNSISSKGEYITVHLLHKDSSKLTTDSFRYIPLKDMPLSINIRDKENKTKSYNMTTNAKGQVLIDSLEKRNYHVSVVFKGKYNYKPSRWEGDIDLKNPNSSYRHESLT